MRLARTLILATLLLAPIAAHAIGPDEMLANPALEARARTISSQLRCLVCQNESIEDSQAPLAKDLRLLVRRHVLAGESNAHIIKFLVARYGDFILLKPPFEPQTLLLWFAPALALGAGGLLAWRASRRDKAREPLLKTVPLSETERARLDGLLNEGTPDHAAGKSG
ncbi:MAG TPA: cytochrome c-type biogenesis protein [Beijerinckiaceae bacterium]|nr:cytochrome c-type biogenesis protein [Beijerinckiaceae bacterium]